MDNVTDIRTARQAKAEQDDLDQQAKAAREDLIDLVRQSSENERARMILMAAAQAGPLYSETLTVILEGILSTEVYKAMRLAEVLHRHPL